MSDDLKPDDLAELSKVLREDWDSLTRRGGEMAADAIDRLIAAERARDEAVADRDRLRAALEEIASRGCWAAGDIWSCEVVARAALGAQPLPPHTTASSTADPVSDAAAETRTQEKKQ